MRYLSYTAKLQCTKSVALLPRGTFACSWHSDNLFLLHFVKYSTEEGGGEGKEERGKKGKGDKGGKGEGAFGLSCCLKGQDNLVYVTTRIKIVLISKF